jgi:caffeoyl-CoA O-methyltransferase
MSKIVENPEAYFREFVPGRSDLLKELEKEAGKEEIPIVGPVVGELLAILACVTRSKRVLELGTATGYSAIYLAQACEETDGRVVTLESDPVMAERARKNLQRAGFDRLVEVRQGDARKVMETMEGPYDLIFMDIDKEYYLPVLPHCYRLLARGGLLVADNVGFADAQDFTRTIFDDPRWKAVHLLSFLPLHSPEKDGLCLALRR